MGDLKLPIPFDGGRFREMLRRGIVFPLGPAKDGSEIVMLRPAMVVWAQMSVNDMGSLMFPLVDILLRRYVYNCFC